MCRVLLDYLNHSEKSRFRGLDLDLKIQGSILEGTRVGCADELDLALSFGGISTSDVFICPTKATQCKVRMGKGSNPISYMELFKLLLEDTSLAFESCSKDFPGSIGIGVPNSVFKPCDKCLTQEGEDKPPEFCTTHCTHCLPPVTMTKMGLCLLATHNGVLISIDIIPGLANPENDPLKLHDMVTRTLLQDNPPNWLAYLKKYLKTDRILPEALAYADQKQLLKPVSMKVLHFGPGGKEQDNFILRAGQILDMEELENPKLKKVYCTLKVLKVALGVSIQSYLMKKVLLLQDFLSYVKGAFDEFQILQLAMSHPHLRGHFFDRVYKTEAGDQFIIDRDAWKSHLKVVLSDKEDWLSHFRSAIPIKLL